MKLPSFSRLAARDSRRNQGGLTLVETMVTMVIFIVFVMGTLVYSQLFMLKQDQLVQSKLGASDQSRRGFNQLADDIRSAKIWDVGDATVTSSGSITAFTTISNGFAQQGTALRLGLTTDTNIFILYCFDTNKCELRRGHSNVTGSKLIAGHLTNSMYFRAENYRGEVQMDLTHKGVINVMLQFKQFQYPLTVVGPGYLYDFYKMEFRFTPHVPDGP